MFKQFDIDYDKIAIDGKEINKPSYISSSEWLGFWKYSSSEENEAALERSYQSGLEENEKEHEKEIEELIDLFDKELLSLQDSIEDLILNDEYSSSDLKYYISKNFDRLKDKVWR
jgi:hypothetical protein